MTYTEWRVLCILLEKASDALVAASPDGEEDDDAGTLTSALEVAKQYRDPEKVDA